MCGIAGFLRLGGSRRALPTAADLDRMTDALAHRGPDGRGTLYDSAAGIGLGHRRLSIRDLSPAGAQPMVSASGRFVIVYNGEVYSHVEIATDLKAIGRSLRGHSDTEIILEACAEWGVERVVPRLIGMFAFALFDQATRELTLARDRLGIKPLYWSATDGLLMFGSELKALRQIPGWAPKVDRNALAAFMRHNYVPAPWSIYDGVRKLEPGSILTVAADGVVKTRRFWNLREIAETEVRAKTAISDQEAVGRLDELVTDAVRRRLVSDVPVGALLSGGIDSSLVTALMSESAGRRINTFSVGFREKTFDEAPFAKEVARHLGTDHTELYANGEEAIGLVGRLPEWYDEPFADSSQLPTALVCALTRQHVKVVLTGDGGDELFAGYQRYTIALDLWDKAKRVPRGMRALAGRGLLAVPGRLVDAVQRRARGWLGQPGLQSKVRQYAEAMVGDDPGILYRRTLSHWDAPDTVVINGHEPKGVLWDQGLTRSVPDYLDRMMLMDTVTYLPDDILAKVDRASMAVGLEARVPLLDHRLVEYSWSLPRHMKLRGGVTKWALRELLYRRVPRALVERPKMGFGVPLAEWLRGPLRDWAEALLAERRLSGQGLFAAAPIRDRWQAHLAGANWAYPLWNVLMAQAWIDANPDVAL